VVLIGASLKNNRNGTNAPMEHAIHNRRDSNFRSKKYAGKPTIMTPINEAGTPRITPNKSPTPTSLAMPASELPNPEIATAGMLANGASSKDAHGIEYLFEFPNTSYLQTCQVYFWSL